MKKTISYMVLFAALTLSGVWANAREDVRSGKRAGKTSFKTEAGDCVTPQAQFDLDINNVRARLLTGGDMWWNLAEARYEVPKGDGTGPSLNAIFSGTIWVTGFDAGGNLKCAAQRYRGGGDDYWPGPLVNGVIDKSTCSKYDRFFNVYGDDIAKAQTAFLQKGDQLTLADIPKGVLSWPGKGNPYLSSDPSLLGETFNIDDNLAPFKDVDGDEIYDPLNGDFPYIPSRVVEDAQAYGDQMVFWVINDVGNQHTESNGQAIGVQINCLAFAFQTTNDVNNMTFYRYEIINKSSEALNKTYISQNCDPDLGDFKNDAIGCDTTRSLGIIYNRVTPDESNGGVAGYGTELPLCGIDFFEGPLSDSGTQLGMSSFIYYTNGGTFDNDPSSAPQYRNYQDGFWLTGAPITEGGNGFGGTVPTKFVYPGSPDDPTGWSECSTNQPPGDRRFVQTSGPFTLMPGVSQFVTIGVVFIRPPGGVNICPNFANDIGSADDLAQGLFDTGFKLLDGPSAPTLNIRELSNQIIINLINERGSNNFGESYDEVDKITLKDVNKFLDGKGDSTYTFEGYRIFQLANPSVSATELDDATKARQVAQVDIKNGISKIINYKTIPELGILQVPFLTVDGEDKGISASFNITTDVFASGSNSNLINHKTYYFTAIAYAHNSYKAYDQLAPTTGGQLLPYLQGRGNFKVYSAIPHIPDPRNEGTIITSHWNDSVTVKRIEGQGNGGSNLQLDAETINRIITSGDYAFADTLTYVKGFDPIGFKVTDPVSLKEADFELTFVDSNTGAIGKTTSWILHDLTNNDTIFSERNLDRPYEQLIALNKGGERIDYGFAVKLGTPAKVYTVPANHPTTGFPERYVYDVLPSSIEFQNKLEPWLSFLPDAGIEEPANWIRSGKLLFDATGPDGGLNPSAGVYDDNWYFSGNTVPTSGYKFSDSLEVFEKILGGTWAPYCLTASYAKRDLIQTEIDARKDPFVYGPGFKWRNYGESQPPQNNLDKLASVDVVITPDKSKWSRCIVFETGEDEGINQGADIAPNGKAARKGQIRMARSKTWNNPVTRDALIDDPSTDIGRSWFPGYAVNVETGQRLNIAFGESSDQGLENGRDMLWNPTLNLYAPVADQVLFGGKHFIYVMDTKYDEGDSAQKLLLNNYANLGSLALKYRISTDLHPLYYSLMWTAIPYLSRGYSFVEGYIPPAEVSIKLRVEKPYNRLATVSTAGDSLPRYQFSTKGMGATEKNKEVATSACDMMRAVPNPYLAYSAYETDQNSNKIKITNLPNKCNITIYSLDGTIIRKLSRAIDVDPSSNKKIDITDGASGNDINLDNSIDWDLKNDKSIPVAGGVYLIHIEAPGICEKTIKWFGAIRPADTSNF